MWMILELFVDILQSFLISKFTSNYGHSVNCSKTEVVNIFRSATTDKSTVHVQNTKCLGYQWSKSLSARVAVEENFTKARRQFLVLGSSGCYLGPSNPLTASAIVVTPTLLRGAENWIIDNTSLHFLERFQA